MLQRTNLRRASKRGSIALFAFLARALEQVSTLVATLLAARFLVPAEYGLFSLANVFIILIQTLTYTGVYQFILTSKEEEEIILSTCFWLIIGLLTAASALLALLAYPLQWLFQTHELAHVLLLLALVQPFAGIVAWSSAALLRKRAIFLHYSFVFWQNLITLVLGSVLLVFWHSLYALVAIQYLRALTGTLLFAGLGRTWPQFHFRKSLAVKAATFSGNLYSSRFLAFLARYAGDLMLGLFHTPAEVGLYRFGTRIATGATDTLTQPMSNFAATQFGSAARDGEDLAGPLARFAGTTTLLTGLVGAVIIVFGSDIILAFFQPSYMTALVVTYAMALRGAAGVGQLLMEPTFAALGRTSWVMKFNLVSAAMAIIAILIASPFGLLALAWSQLGSVICATAWATYLVRSKGGVDVTRAIQKTLLGIALATIYGLILFVIRDLALPLFTLTPVASLGVGIALAGLIAIIFVVVGALLRVLSLQSFSG